MNTTDLTQLNSQLLDKIMFAHKEGDWLVLGDNTLRAALAKTRPLTRNEWNALMASPLTLRRLRYLVHEREAAKCQPDLSQAANDDQWFGSEGLLKAAMSDDAAPPLATLDEAWTLLFLKGATGYRMVLKLDPNARFAASLLAAQTELVVLDAAGKALMQGTLDEDGELHGDWLFPDTSPYAHFQASGNSFTIRPC